MQSTDLDDDLRQQTQRAGGLVSTAGAAEILGVTPTAVARRHQRARRDGYLRDSFPRPIDYRDGKFPLWSRRQIMERR